MKFSDFSPYLLRFAIEIELQNTNDTKMASIMALKRLKDDPEYYHNKYGYIEPLEKARNHKYAKRVPDGKGGWVYIYKEDQKKNAESQTEKIKLKMRFDANSLFFNFNVIGFEKRIGTEKTSEKSLKKTEEIENSIKDFNKEYTLAINQNGELLFSKIGNYDEIAFNDIEIKQLRNSEILTHTHPEDKSFSVEDVFLALSLGIKELRVKTPENTYYFKISHKKDIDEQNLNSNNRTFMTVLTNINNIVTSYYRKKVREKSISLDKAEKEHRELVWELVAQSPILQEDFNIEYGKVEK